MSATKKKSEFAKQAGLYIHTGFVPASNTAYLVTFKIVSGTNSNSSWEVNFDGDGSSKLYGEYYSGGPDGFLFNKPITPSSDAITFETKGDVTANGPLTIKLCLGTTTDTYTISDLKIVKKDNSHGVDQNRGKFGGRSVDTYVSTLVVGDGYATVNCIGNATDDRYKRGLLINDICSLADNTDYRISFDVASSQDTPYEVLYNKDGNFGASEKVYGFAIWVRCSASTWIMRKRPTRC